MSGDFTPDFYANYKATTTTNTKNFRNISTATAQKYGVRHSIDVTTGLVEKQYYPITKQGELSGIKWRTADKRFSNRGVADSTCDLFGQAIFKSSPSPNIIIASGELDALSIYDMLASSNNSTYENTPVVSAITGEAGALTQYKNNYEFLNKFQKIFICPDQDKAGLDALHKVAKVLPRDKLFVIELPLKDANKMLEKGKVQEFKSRYIKARHYSPSGIVGSDVFFDELLQSFETSKLSLPPFLHDVQENMLMRWFRIPLYS